MSVARCPQSKVVITIEDEAATATTTMRGVGLVVGTLAVVGVLALLFALRRLGVGRRPEEPEGSEEPRARAMSVEELEHEGPEDQTVRATGETQGDPSEWSLVSEVAGPSSWRQGVEASTEDCRSLQDHPKEGVRLRSGVRSGAGQGVGGEVQDSRGGLPTIRGEHFIHNACNYEFDEVRSCLT